MLPCHSDLTVDSKHSNTLPSTVDRTNRPTELDWECHQIIDNRTKSLNR